MFKLVSGIVFLALVAFGASAQSTAPSGAKYTTPDLIAGYNWVQGVAVSQPELVTITYTGKKEWVADNPMVCRNACEAFMSCKAFMFTEPVSPRGKPRCRMLSDVTTPVVTRNVHLYTRAD